MDDWIVGLVSERQPIHPTNPFIHSSSPIWPEAKWRRDPFSRSYGAILPSSLERFLSRALVYSTHPPVSVYGTGNWGYDWRLVEAHCPVRRFGGLLGGSYVGP